jgi:4-methylaminobutanoate oxidase (formaldehyde-forming)
LGQITLEKKKDSATKKRKINFALSNNDLFMYHNEPILFDGKIVGEITSGMYGFYLDKSLGMGYISASDSCSIEEMISLQKFEIEIAETKYKADGSIKCFYDPGRKKILI